MLRHPVFIHGWSFSSKLFGAVQGIKVNLPSHGGSRDSYTDFDATVERLALSFPSKHDIVGWSLGGSVALLLALRFPSKVNRLFLIGTSPYFEGAWDKGNIRAFKLMVRREGVSRFRRLALGKDFEDNLEEKGALRMLEDYIRLDLRDKATLIRKETFVIQGEDDRVVPVKEAIKLHNIIKGSKLIILPGGHFPAEDERSLLFTLLKISKHL